MADLTPSFGKDLTFQCSTAGSSTSAVSNIVDISRHVMSVDGLPGEREFADVTCGGGAVAHEWLTGMIAGDITVVCLMDQSSADCVSAWKTLSPATTEDTDGRYFIFGPGGTGSGYPKVTGKMRVKSVVAPAKPLEPLIFTVTASLDSTVSVTTFA